MGRDVAASEFDLHADELVLNGSHGVPADDAGDLTTDHEHPGRQEQPGRTLLGSQGWVSGDLVDAGLGNDPAEDDFGAKRVQAEYIDRGWAWNFEDHIHCYDKDGESLYNVAAIATGQYDQAEFAGHRTDPWYADPVAPELDREPREIHHGR